ncbi:MAG: elongation factor G [Oscillospiraceae bacterium]|nr:elongation factor G [Oscillospiraceae bacterium]
MKAYKCKNIRNIALAGHNASGKTTLAEALLAKSGALSKIGKVSEGSSVCDHEPEEIKRKISLSTSMAYMEWREHKINMLDTPGQFDFIGGMSEGMRAAETVIITVSARDGVQIGTIKAYNEAFKQRKAIMFVVTKSDEEDADFGKALAGLKEHFGNSVCDFSDKEAVSELAAETDEELMNAFLDAGELTGDQLIRGVTLGLVNGGLTPVVSVPSGEPEEVGVLLDLIVDTFPSPCTGRGEPLNTEAGGDFLQYNDEGQFSGFVFKTIADPFVGKMSFVKVITGSLNSKTEPINRRTGEIEKFGKMLIVRGKKQEEIGEVCAGDIVTLTKLDAVTNDSLCGSAAVAKSAESDFAAILFPAACFFRAINVKGKGDEAKISGALKRFLEEDKVLSYVNNTETRQRVIGGLGDQHLDVVVNKLKSKFGVEVELSEPIIAYRETIRKKVTGVEGKHKKQSGGAGQFGVVTMDFEPHYEDDIVFEEKVVGGSVPKQFFPAVEKGLRESTMHGALAGYPVVRIKATLTDGKYHPVDSKEVAFIQAAKQAFKAGMKNASPCLLEPILSMKITVGNNNTGDIMGVVNKRRGAVLGTVSVGNNMTQIDAEMPQAETTDFALVLLQMTKGLGHFTQEFTRYEPLPPNLEADVIANAPAVAVD